MIRALLSSLSWPVGSASTCLLPLVLLGACGGGSDSTEAEAGGSATASAAAAPTPAAWPTPAPVAAGVDSFCGLPSFQAELMSRINAARASTRNCGSTSYPAAGSVNWNSALFAAAEAHSRDMAVNNFFSHTGLDGRSVSQRVSSAGYGWRAVGENIAAGQTSVAAVMNGWLASPGHCGNIMTAQYQDVAVACVQRTGSDYGTYWTMVLARPS